MRRRELITLLGGAAASWPVGARAQQATMSVIGYLGSTAPSASADQMAGFAKGLSETGFIDGKNIVIEYHWASGQYNQLPVMAAEFVSRGVSVILASGLPAVLAAKAKTSTIPIVFTMGADPVGLRVVPSLNRPNGNITGVSQLYGALGGKRLELLREILPTVTTIVVLSNPNNPNADSHLSDVQAAARATAQKIKIATARTEAEINAVFANLIQERPACCASRGSRKLHPVRSARRYRRS